PPPATTDSLPTPTPPSPPQPHLSPARPSSPGGSGRNPPLGGRRRDPETRPRTPRSTSTPAPFPPTAGSLPGAPLLPRREREESCSRRQGGTGRPGRARLGDQARPPPLLPADSRISPWPAPPPAAGPGGIRLSATKRHREPGPGTPRRPSTPSPPTSRSRHDPPLARPDRT